MADNVNNKKRGRPRILVKKKRNVQFLNSLQLPTSNRFSALSDSDNAMQTDEAQQQAKKSSISPIVVTDHQTDIQKILIPLEVNFNLKLNSVGRKFFPATSVDKKKIIDKLNKEKISYFTHPEKDSKAFKVILSGLPQVDTVLIKSSLAEQNLTPTKITMFNTNSSNKLYLLHFDASQVNKKTLDAVKYVYHHVITWLPYKPKRNGPTICLRCCMYGHGIQSCARYVVCMLCAGEHLTKDCTTHNNNNTNTIFACFNCKSANLPHNHKANDVNCPFRLKYETARNNARNKTRTPINQRSQANTTRLAPAPTPPPLRTSFADSLRTQTASSSHTATTHTQSQAHSNTRFNNTSSRSTTNDNVNNNPSSNLWSFDECAEILFSSIEQLQQCQNKLEQLKVIANLLKHACK